ncbi:DUF1232 domain-containing protein [Geobacter hydrogenophilus]|uniref:DUF1232 domain-containing protein n=1 Tax=Geobacter hydrogenophilus TaxID=40983 RepID=A0A9W6G495_9BACT|nr:YkvA family protein [Geobacter hydrogenophilus]MBT0892718.1 DUF1232 domain-containing protein [Geobacter hydrogenophilus]GLI40117.1 hypothetical protein GHYDROH2_36180 [Geobacter hydrogenophilus]
MAKDYSIHYSEDSLKAKIGRFARTAGRELIEKVLVLYHTLRAPSTPKWARAAILGALGYFISPIDTIPDLIPGVGYTDDLAVIAAALVTVASHITPEIKAKARAQVAKLFGEPFVEPEEESGERDAPVTQS